MIKRIINSLNYKKTVIMETPSEYDEPSENIGINAYDVCCS